MTNSNKSIIIQDRATPKNLEVIDHERVLGQFFTPNHIVEEMLGLRRNLGRILEPSSGQGAFLNYLDSDAVGIEIDSSLTTDPRVVISDYFVYSTKHKFDTIIGNPPYVRFQDIRPDTREKLPMELFDCRTNLYLFFIAKSISHLNPKGELIFITPRNFLKATAAKKLNEILFRKGTMTHYYELGDEKIFDNAAPNCAIWRWEKGNSDRQVATGAIYRCVDGQIYFGQGSNSKLGVFFDVKVGAVSGADDVFTNDKRGCTEMVCSTTAKDGKNRRTIYNRYDHSLLPHKQRLLNRRIRHFDEHNWWEWGRKYCVRDGARIYVNGKTRNKNPFYISETKAYDGSVLALFPKNGIDLDRAVQQLNTTNWQELGFVCDGRLLFTQRSLANAPIELQ